EAKTRAVCTRPRSVPDFRAAPSSRCRRAWNGRGTPCRGTTVSIASNFRPGPIAECLLRLERRKARARFAGLQRSDAEAAMSSDVSTGQIETREQEAFMRRLILQTGISIDGYVAALDRSHPWGEWSEDESVQR